MSTEISVAVRRAVIETNLEQCRDAAASSFIQIGRWLNRAKDEGVVPHGEWLAWVAEHAGMNERSAQRCMQIAREVPEGSLLEGMNMTKVRALLTLPQAEREDAAREMGAQEASSGEVERRVRALREERDEALRLVGEQKKAAQRARQEADRAQDRAVQEAIAAERKDREELLGERRELLRTIERNKKSAADMAAREKEMGKRVDFLTEEVRRAARYKEELFAAQSDMRMLRDQLARAQAGSSIGPLVQARLDEQQARIEELKETLRERESEIDSLSEQLDDAQMQAARGGMTGEMRIAPDTRILSAIGALMAEAGKCIGELREQMDTIDAQTRELLIGQASMVGTWAMNIIAACGGDMRDFAS